MVPPQAAGIDWQIAADIAGLILFAVLSFLGVSMYNDLKNLRETAVTRRELQEAIISLEEQRQCQHEENRTDRRYATEQTLRQMHELRKEIGDIHEKVNTTNVNVAELRAKARQ